MPSRSAESESPQEALARFLKRVLREHRAARESLAVGPVHDLRVALRRCRSLSEGFGSLDRRGEWRRLYKSAKKLQAGLAGLRDAQVMAGRVRRLRITAAAVAESLRSDERKAKGKAIRALEDFPRKRWKRWRKRLPKRAAELEATQASFAGLALERIREAAEREQRWRHSGSRVAAHSLRIAVKHFRYTVQSFLPELYAVWDRDLRRMQDALGDIHDLDVLRRWLLQVTKEKSLDHELVHGWVRQIAALRQERVDRYKKTVSAVGKHGAPDPHAPVLWNRWRGEIERLAAPNSPAREESLE